MDPAILSAASALTGSLIGGVSMLAASWLTQRQQFRAQALVHEAVKRETLYAEFIIEASKRLTEAWSRQAETPEVVAGLYSAVERMRLTSSPEVIRVAEQAIRFVIDAYADASKTFDEVRERLRSDDWGDPLRDFAEACRTELRALRG
ncbi:MAG TPA: hypothetical protein VN808_05415 [Stellaceae bacterium]|nr:hypothetical protein [Stellaceae bacterium]